MKKLSAILSAAVLALCAIPTQGAASELVSVPSGHDVTTTMDALETVVRHKGMSVFARIDHAANASAAGLQMPPAQVLVFGKPQAGTALMNQDIRVGLDLPMRVLVYQDTEGKAWLLYHRPSALAQAYGALADHPVLEKLDAAMAALSTAAAAGNTASEGH